MNAEMSFNVPTEPSRRWGRRLLAVGIVIVTGIVVLIWGLWLYPQTPPEPLLEIAATTSALSLFLVVPAAVTLALAALAWRIWWRWGHGRNGPCIRASAARRDPAIGNSSQHGRGAQGATVAVQLSGQPRSGQAHTYRHLRNIGRATT